MYGVPADLGLSQFVGTTCVQLCLAQYQAVFHFQASSASGPGHSCLIDVQCAWELHGAEGNLVAQGRGDNGPEAHVLHGLLGHDVTDVAVDAPRSITLRFDTGEELLVVDDSEQYESFSIQPGDIYV